MKPPRSSLYRFVFHVCLGLSLVPDCPAFLVSPPSFPISFASSSTALPAKKPASKKGGATGPSTVKGFGSSKPSPSSSSSFPGLPHTLLRDQGHLSLIDWVQQRGAEINHLGVASVQPQNIRGIVTLKPFKKGETIISIPYALAIDVTPTALSPSAAAPKLADPVPAALELLKQLDDPAFAAAYAPYLAMVPSPTAKEGEGGYGMTTGED